LVATYTKSVHSVVWQQSAYAKMAKSNVFWRMKGDGWNRPW